MKQGNPPTADGCRIMHQLKTVVNIPLFLKLSTIQDGAGILPPYVLLNMGLSRTRYYGHRGLYRKKPLCGVMSPMTPVIAGVHRLVPCGGFPRNRPRKSPS